MPRGVKKTRALPETQLVSASGRRQKKVTDFFPTVPNASTHRKRGKPLKSLEIDEEQTVESLKKIETESCEEQSVANAITADESNSKKTAKVTLEANQLFEKIEQKLPDVDTSQSRKLETKSNWITPPLGLTCGNKSMMEKEPAALSSKIRNTREKQAISHPPSPIKHISEIPSARTIVEAAKKNDSTVDNHERLPLPPKYEHLLTLFDYTEVVVSWLETQGKRVTFNEVMNNVKRRLKSNFSLTHFAQILHVYPEAYNVRIERRWAPIGGRNIGPDEYEYVIQSNLDEDSKALEKAAERLAPDEASTSNYEGKFVNVVKSPMKAEIASRNHLHATKINWKQNFSSEKGRLIKSPVKLPYRYPDEAMKSPKKGFIPKLEGFRYKRKVLFRSRLYERTHEQHVAFLKSIGFEVPEGKKIMRYHPDFKLESVDEIPEARLPQMPEGDAGQPESMREYLKNVPDSGDSLPAKIKEAIKELRSPVKQVSVVAGNNVPLSPRKYVEQKKTENKLSLLERIRAKERERKLKEMLINPELEQKKVRLEKISQYLLQVIWSYYNLCRVRSIKYDDLIAQMSYCLEHSSPVEMEASVSLLCEVCPQFFKMVVVRGQKYVQFKENDFNEVKQIIDGEIKKCS